MSSSIFDWVHFAAQNIWLYGGAFVLVLSILVFIHEWGHYIIARLCGVKIESFSIGFGPELFGVTDRQGTRWKFSLVPLGGYVKMFGDVDPASARHINGIEEKSAPAGMRSLTSEEKSVAFYTQPVFQRAAIVFAGPAINFIFAVIVLAFLYMFHGEPVTPPMAAGIISGSAAEQAGFLPLDEIVAIDGKKIRRFEDIRREVLVGLDTRREFTIMRGDIKLTIQAAPKKMEDKDHFGFKHSSGLLGLISPGNAIEINRIKKIDGRDVKTVDEARRLLIARMDQTIKIDLDRGPEVDTLIIHPSKIWNEALKDPKHADYSHLVIADPADSEITVHHGLPDALAGAVRETSDITVSTLVALGQMITGTRSATELGGIIRIGALAGDMAKSGVVALIAFTAMLSINLGLINLFPIPMLDGGHLLFYSIEIVKGSPISEQIQEYAFRLGLAILIGIMLFANLNDIVQLFL